jgi:hypothetical protein
MESISSSNRKRYGFLIIFLVSIFLISVVSAGNFDLGESSLKFKIIPGGIQEISFNIHALAVGQFSLIAVPSWASISETSFTLKQNEQKLVSMKVDGAGLSEGVYVSSITVRSDNDVQVLPVVLEVQSSDTFFGGSLEIPLKYHVITPSDSLLAQLRIYDLVSANSDVKLGAANVYVTYAIYSIGGTAILRDSEKVNVDNMLRLTKVISFNKDFAPGTYVLATSVRYGTGISTSTALFDIKKKSWFSIPSFSIPSIVLFWILVILCLALFIFIGYELRKWFFLNRESRKVDVQRRANSIFRDG